MPGQNTKIGRFAIKKELAKNRITSGSYIDRQSLIDLHNQFPFEDVTDRLLRKYINESAGKVSPTPFIDFLEANNRRISVTEPFIRYKKMGKANTHWQLMRTVVGSTPGLHQTLFEVVLNTDVLKSGSRIRPEETFQYQVAIQSGPEAFGDGYKYKVQYITPDRGTYFPTQFLREGTRWMVAGSPNFSERSLDWGPLTQFQGHSVLVYEVPLFNASYSVEITDEALNHTYKNQGRVESINYVYNIDAPEGSGLPKSTISDVELRIKAEAKMLKEHDLLLGRSGLPVKDTSTDLFRKIGTGILPFIEDGHNYRYNTNNFRIQEITDFLDTVWYNQAGEIEFELGREALKLVDKAIRREFGEHTFIESFDQYVEKTGRVVPGGVEGWKLKAPMFNAYELQPWGVVKFKHAPWMDNRDFRGPLHPTTGAPLLSYSMIASRLYGSGPQSNIVLVDRPGFDIWNFTAGQVGPGVSFSGNKNIGVHGGRYGNIYHQSEYGIFMEDINDMVYFMPDIK
jgi:hypothetical protein